MRVEKFLTLRAAQLKCAQGEEIRLEYVGLG